MASRGPGRAVSRLLLDPRLEPTYGCHEVPVVQIEGMAPVGEVHGGYDPFGHQEDGGVSSSLSAVDGEGGVVGGGADLGQDRFRLTGEALVSLFVTAALVAFQRLLLRLRVGPAVDGSPVDAEALGDLGGADAFGVEGLGLLHGGGRSPS